MLKQLHKVEKNKKLKNKECDKDVEIYMLSYVIKHSDKCLTFVHALHNKMMIVSDSMSGCTDVSANL